jgi:hypothetical protein
MARERRLDFLMVDESLLAFLESLSQRPEQERKDAFVSCAPLYGGHNPYLPDSFFRGRENLLSKLWDSAGPVLAYGGRGLGKSSLLMELANDPARHKPKEGQHVLYASCNGHSSFSPILEGLLRPLGLERDKRKSPDPLESLCDRALDLLNGKKGQSKVKKVLLLLDDADPLLLGDMDQGFPELTLMATIMEQAPSFRIVLCGGRVARLLGREVDNPLSKGRQPLGIGPFDPEDADQLLRIPLKAMGVDFPSDSVPQRALSLANGYPGPLKALGARLAETTFAGAYGSLPPVTMECGDLVSAISDMAGKGGPKDILRASLLEHPFHKALAYAIYYLSPKGLTIQGRFPGHGITAFDILKELGPSQPPLARLGEAGLEALLEEMADLSILRRENVGYRLRCHDASELLGDVDNEVIELMTGDKPLPSDLEPPVGPMDRRLCAPFEWKEDSADTRTCHFMRYRPGEMGLLAHNNLETMRDGFPSPLNFQEERLVLDPPQGHSAVVGTALGGIGRVWQSLAALGFQRCHTVDLLHISTLPAWHHPGVPHGPKDPSRKQELAPKTILLCQVGDWELPIRNRVDETFNELREITELVIIYIVRVTDLRFPRVLPEGLSGIPTVVLRGWDPRSYPGALAALAANAPGKGCHLDMVGSPMSRTVSGPLKLRKPNISPYILLDYECQTPHGAPGGAMSLSPNLYPKDYGKLLSYGERLLKAMGDPLANSLPRLLQEAEGSDERVEAIFPYPAEPVPLRFFRILAEFGLAMPTLPGDPGKGILLDPGFARDLASLLNREA